MGNNIRSLFSEVETIPPVLQSSYYPSLNGLRGVAILMVVFSHLKLASGYFYNVIFNGPLGVLIFFVLSGFLITTLCIKEKIITKDISLKNFYIRRVLRIFPVAYLYILVVIILNIIFKLQIHWVNFLGSALYLMNFSSYFRKYYSSYFTGHYWSLSVEEQFYLFVPFILKKNFKLFLRLIVFIVFIVPVVICLQYFYANLNNGVLYGFSHYLIKFQAIAVGCLASVIVFKYPLKKIITKNKGIANTLAILLILLIQYNDFFDLHNMLMGVVSSLLIAYVLTSNLYPGTDLIFKFLNARIMKFIGVLSYSIYIWQEIFTSQDKKLPAFLIIFPYNLICIVTVSCLSYYFYESFFLKLKSKFSLLKSRRPVPVS